MPVLTATKGSIRILPLRQSTRNPKIYLISENMFFPRHFPQGNVKYFQHLVLSAFHKDSTQISPEISRILELKSPLKLIPCENGICKYRYNSLLVVIMSYKSTENSSCYIITYDDDSRERVAFKKEDSTMNGWICITCHFHWTKHVCLWFLPPSLLLPNFIRR